MYGTFYSSTTVHGCTLRYTCRGRRSGFIGGNARFPLCGTVERTMTKETEREELSWRRQKLLEEEEMGPIARACFMISQRTHANLYTNSIGYSTDIVHGGISL